MDREPEKRKTDWKLNDRWAWFIGKDRPPIKLTTDPEPYTLERTLGWISRQVAPTLKMLKKIDAGNSTSYLKEIEDNSLLEISTGYFFSDCHGLAKTLSCIYQRGTLHIPLWNPLLI